MDSKTLINQNYLNNSNKENIYTFLDTIIEKLKNDENNKTFDIDIYPNEKNIFKTNVNNDRIKKCMILTKILNTCQTSFLYFNLNHLNTIELCDDDDLYDEYTNNENILMFWRSISKRVEKKEVLNFPICVYIQFICSKIISKEIKKKKLYFLKHKEYTLNEMYNNSENFKANIFQKFIIFYTLDTIYGLSSDNYMFDKIFNESNKFTYKIKDLIFTASLENILLLSPKTKLIKQKMDINFYINSLDLHEKKLIDCNKIYENFYEFFLINFNEFFDKKIYNTKNIKQILELSIESNDPKPGNIYILSNPKLSVPVYIIILSSNETHIKYLILFDSTISKTLSLTIKVVKKNTSENVYYYPDFIFEKSFYYNSIGF